MVGENTRNNLALILVASCEDWAIGRGINFKISGTLSIVFPAVDQGGFVNTEGSAAARVGAKPGHVGRRRR